MTKRTPREYAALAHTVESGDYDIIEPGIAPTAPVTLTIDSARHLAAIIEATYPSDSRVWRIDYLGPTVDSDGAELELREMTPLRLGASAAIPGGLATDALSSVLVVTDMLNQHVIAMADLLAAARDGRLALKPSLPAHAQAHTEREDALTVLSRALTEQGHGPVAADPTRVHTDWVTPTVDVARLVRALHEAGYDLD